MAKEVKDVGASVRARLLNLSRTTGQSNDLLLTRYALERLLYRLTKTDHAKRFVLKGAILMTTWFDDPHRPTRDIDLLGFGDPRPDEMLKVFREICSVEENDGVQFDVDKLEVTANREDLAYGGLRLQTYAIISGARLRIVIDIGFGDSGSRKSTTASGSSASCITIWDTSTWNRKRCKPSTTRSARGCHLCSRNVLLPMYPVRTRE